MPPRSVVVVNARHPGRERNGRAGCPPSPALKIRPLLTAGQAVGVSRLFKVLAGGSRLRLLHALVRAGELCVNDLAQEAGMKPQAVSNQLQRLADRGIVETRRDGLKVHYRIVDPCVTELLDRGLCLVEERGRPGR